MLEVWERANEEGENVVQEEEEVGDMKEAKKEWNEEWKEEKMKITILSGLFVYFFLHHRPI